MAGAFQSGFQMGQSAYQQALDNRDREERRKREADEYGLRRQQLVLQNQAAEDAAAQRRELAGIRTQLADSMGGFDRAGFNTAANNDFDSALAASDAAVKAENVARKGGLAAPAAAFAPPAQGNLAAEQGMRAQFTQAPDITSDAFQRGMSGLRQRYALAAGDMKGFDDMAAAERNRLTAADDAAFARAVTSNPEGPEAKAARTYVNRNSRKLSTRADPKTNMTTFILAQDDGYSEVKVNPGDLAKIAVGVRRLERGDVGGLDVISAVNKELAAAVREDMKLDLDVGKGNNDAAFKSGSLKNDADRNAESKRHNQAVEGIQKDRANAERNQILGSALNYSLGTNGELVPTMTGLKLNARTGDYEGVSVPLTGQRGIIPAAAFDQSRIAKSVEAMVGQPTGQIGRDGKPIVYTPETAQAAVVQQIIRAHTSQNPATSLNAAGVKAAQEAAGGGGASRASPRGPAYGTPEYDALVERQRLGAVLQSRNSGLPEVMRRPVDYSIYATPAR